MNKKLDIRYIAGLVDGDGCVNVGWSDRNHRVLNLVLSISNTHLNVLKRLKSDVGGIVLAHHKPTNPRHKQAWTWKMCGYEACDLLDRILPYLVIKKLAAKNALKWRKLKRGFSRSNRITKKDYAERVAIYTKSRELNFRGVPNNKFKMEHFNGR